MASRTPFTIACIAGLTLPGVVDADGPPNVPVFGFPHQALGQADLAIDPQGNLTVTNIGSSGLDGYRVGLGEAEGYTVRYDAFLPLNSMIRLDSVGSIGGVEQLISLFEVLGPTVQESKLVIVAESEIETFWTIEIIDNGQVVHTEANHAPGPMVVAPVGPLEIFSDGFESGAEITTTAVWGDDPNYLFEIVGGPSIVGDAVRVSTTPTDTIQYLSAVNVSAADVPVITVLSEGFYAFDNEHLALGNAEMTSSYVDEGFEFIAVTATNIGSSGLDGVRINRPGVPDEAIAMVIEPDAGGQPNSVLEIATRGIPSGAAAGGGQAVPAGRQVFTDTGPEVDLLFDFLAAMPSGVTLEYFLDGNQVGGASLPGGTAHVTIATANPLNFTRVCHRLTDGEQHVTVGFDSPLTVIAPVDEGAVPVLVDEILGITDGLSNYLASYVTGEVRGANMASFTIVDEFVPAPPQPCDGDLDGDGTVGIGDFLGLLAAWGPNPGHPADLDGDGTVGISDFLTLLGNWGACP